MAEEVQNPASPDDGTHAEASQRPARQPSRTRRISRPGHPSMNLTSGPNARLPQISLSRRISEGPQRPPFSLAGSHAPGSLLQSYVDEEYYRLNPDYNRAPTKPLWGLARPLPRVVRPGMRRPLDPRLLEERRRARKPELDEAPEPAPAEAGPPAAPHRQHQHEPGTQPAPQVDKIPAQKREEKDQDQDTPITPSITPSDRPQAGQQLSQHSQQTPVAGLPIDSTGVFERYGSPADERTNPMEDWTAAAAKTSSREEIDNGDVANRLMVRLSDIPEVSSQELVKGSDADSLDLEAGEKWDDMSDNEERWEYAEEVGNHNFWAPIRSRYREPFAECLASFVAQVIGLCTNLSVLTSNQTAGDYQSSNWAFGFAIMAGIYIAGGISGGHLNPAISIMLSVTRGFPPRKALMYVFAQCLGAFLASLVAFGIYRNAILEFDNGVLNSSLKGSGHAFLPALAKWASPGAGFANEFIATGILGCAILALGDDENAPPGAGMHALIVGILVTALGMAFGYPTGACINPARDIGPRLAALAVGYGGSVFTMDYAWWILGGWVATVSGAVVGGLVYDVAIFTGGESPVNYLGRKMRRDRKGRKLKRWWKRGKKV